MRFRKKPVVIEAVQWDGSECSAEGLRKWANEVELFTDAKPPLGHLRVFIRTLEGTMEVAPGDWIIRGIKGEVYRCKPDIFAMTYDPEKQP